MNILGILKNKVPTGSLVRVNNSNKFIPFENLIILNFLKFFKSKKFKIERYYIDELINKKKDLSFFKNFDLVVTFSLKDSFLIEGKKINSNFLIVEMPYIFRDINKSSKDQSYMRIMWNDHLGNNFVSKYGNEVIRSNFKKIIVKPYKNNGSEILLINQMENDTAITPTDPYKWLEETIYKIRCISDEKITIREHPLQLKKVYKINKLIDKNRYRNCFVSKNLNIVDDLKNARLCVTFSSGSVVDALINGVPSYALDQRSCAYEISNNDLNTLKKPLKNDRKYFLSALSHTHWTFEEISNGSCWNYFKTNFFKNF